jgi:hypothetical protein
MKSTREKIILVVTALVVVWGVLKLVKNAKKDSDQPDTPPDLQSVEQLTAGASGLHAISDPDTIRAILEKAASPWELNPLAELSIETAVVQESGEPQFVYSGFALMQGRKIAIINGREYRNGDQLPFGNYVVESITTNNVILRNSADGNRKSVEKAEQTQK